MGFKTVKRKEPGRLKDVSSWHRFHDGARAALIKHAQSLNQATPVRKKTRSQMAIALATANNHKRNQISCFSRMQSSYSLTKLEARLENLKFIQHNALSVPSSGSIQPELRGLLEITFNM